MYRCRAIKKKKFFKIFFFSLAVTLKIALIAAFYGPHYFYHLPQSGTGDRESST